MNSTTKLKQIHYHKEQIKKLEAEVRELATPRKPKPVKQKEPDQLDQINNVLMGKNAIPEPEGDRQVLYAPRQANIGRKL